MSHSPSPPAAATQVFVPQTTVSSTDHIPGVSPTAKGSRVAFYAALVFSLSWWSILVFTWFSTANPPVVSGPQIRASDAVFVGSLTEPIQPLPEVPGESPRLVSCAIQVTETLVGDPRQGPVHITLLTRGGDLPVGKSFLWPVVPAASTPLRLEGPAAEGFVVTRLPEQSGTSLIYPDTPAYRELIDNAAGADR